MWATHPKCEALNCFKLSFVHPVIYKMNSALRIRKGYHLHCSKTDPVAALSRASDIIILCVLHWGCKWGHSVLGVISLHACVCLCVHVFMLYWLWVCVLKCRISVPLQSSGCNRTGHWLHDGLRPPPPPTVGVPPRLSLFHDRIWLGSLGAVVLKQSLLFTTDFQKCTFFQQEW